MPRTRTSGAGRRSARHEPSASQVLAFSNPLQPLEHFLQRVLVWLHETAGFTWAWSIVALTVCVRILLVPVTVRQIHSMQALQAHAPEMKAIQQKWKHDKQRQNEELMKFYKENKINPASACLPIVAPDPDLHLALLRAPPLRRARAAALRRLGASGSTSSTSPSRSRTAGARCCSSSTSRASCRRRTSCRATMQGAQRILLMVLPVVFVPFILKFPAGLMLYWLTTNLWTTGQGIITRRLMPKPAPPEKRSSRTAPKEEPEPASGNGAPHGKSQGRRSSRPQAGRRPAAAREAQAGRRRRQAMTEITVEATGETVGEAKWSALRELERRVPGARPRRGQLPGRQRGRARAARRRVHAGAAWWRHRRRATCRPRPRPSRATRAARRRSCASCSSGRSRRRGVPRRS